MRWLALVLKMSPLSAAPPALAQSAPDGGEDAAIAAISSGDAEQIVSLANRGDIGPENSLDYIHTAVDEAQYDIARLLIEKLDTDVTKPALPSCWRLMVLLPVFL